MTKTTARKWRFGCKRWIVLGLLVLTGVLTMGVRGMFQPIIPAVILPGEEIWPGLHILPGIPFTNTILATLLADLLLLLLFLPAVQLFIRGKNPVPSGLYLVVEMVMEFVWNMVRGMLEEKWARRALPVIATILLLILTANISKLLPIGFETVGWLKEAHLEHAGKLAYVVDPLGGNWYALDKGRTDALVAERAAHPAENSDAEDHGEAVYELVPFLRGAATDINFPLALAVFSFVTVQVFGFWALGAGGYLGKFFVFRGLISKPLFGLIDFFVGVLEFVLEFVKIISLTLRLFGNIFAGGLILLILGSLVSVFIPAGLAAFELFVGVIQAYVFAILTLIFISLAVQSHHGGEGAEGHPAESR